MSCDLRMDGDFCGESRVNSIQVWLPREENDLDRNPLNDLGKVSGRIVGREKSELRAACRGNFSDSALEGPARQGIDMNIRGSLHANVRKLCLLEIRLDPHLSLNEVNHVCPWSYQLPHKYVPLTNVAARWRGNFGIGKIHLGYDNRRFFRRDVRSVNTVPDIQRFSLAFCGFQLALTRSECSLSPSEICTLHVQGAAELTLLRIGHFELLVRCGFRIEERLLPTQLCQSPLCRRSGRCDSSFSCINGSLRLKDARFGHLDLSVLNSFCGLVVFEGCLRRCQASFCLIQIPLIVGIVKLHQSLPCGDRLVVADTNLADCSGDASAQRCYIGSEVSIIRTLVRPIPLPCGPVTGNRNQQPSSHQQHNDR